MHVVKERWLTSRLDSPGARRALGVLEKTMWRLRPSKVRAGIRRRWFELVMERTPLSPVPGLVHLGSSYGGWIMPGGLIDSDWVCYCVGAGGDITFDLDLIRRYGVTVRAVEPVERYVEAARELAAGVSGLSVHRAAITLADGPLRMGVTHDLQSESVSSAGLYEARRFVELPGRTLPSLMAELGDPRIDLLKLDIEGAEYEVVPQLDLRGLGVKVFAIQLHHTGSVRQARALIAGLARQGYVPVARRSAVKVTFARADLV
jgi:FkbM family methyltransferase